jgi:hypothetical protein
VISHMSVDHYAEAGKAAVVYQETSSGLYLRTREAVAAMCGGLPLVPPGELVWTSQWQPDPATPPIDSPGGASPVGTATRKYLATVSRIAGGQPAGLGRQHQRCIHTSAGYQQVSLSVTALVYGKSGALRHPGGRSSETPGQTGCAARDLNPEPAD